jgi:sulfur oxidation c-type cytochrome SoxX
LSSPKLNQQKVFSILLLGWVLVFFASTPWRELEAASLPDQGQCRDLWDKKLRVVAEIEGWCLFIDANKGHCLDCHALGTNTLPASIPVPGNIGSSLDNLAEIYEDRNKLKSIIFDASIENSDTMMPLYGKHLILTESEIDLVVKFLLSK